MRLKETTNIDILEDYGYVKAKHGTFDVYMKHNPLAGYKILFDRGNPRNRVAIIATRRGYHPNDDVEYIVQDLDQTKSFIEDLIEANLVEQWSVKDGSRDTRIRCRRKVRYKTHRQKPMGRRFILRR